MKKTASLKRICFYIAFALVFTAFGSGLTIVLDNATAETAVDERVEMSIREVSAMCRPGVVQVLVFEEAWNPNTRETYLSQLGSGSGSFIRANADGGYILTNYHVVDAGEVFKILWLDGTEMDATLVGYDDGTDIAILSFEGAVPDGTVPLTMGDSEELQIGDTAICIGNPGASSISLYGTVTSGIISGLDRGDINARNFSRSINLIQVDAAINSGNSGGALLNCYGELVGIPTLKYAAAEGLGFCIPINKVAGYIDEIIETGRVQRPKMGVSVQTYADGPEEAMKNYPPCGVLIVGVMENSSATEAGLRVYDLITEINGQRIYTSDELIAIIDQLSVEDTVELKIYRYYGADGARLSEYECVTISVGLAYLD